MIGASKGPEGPTQKGTIVMLADYMVIRVLMGLTVAGFAFLAGGTMHVLGALWTRRKAAREEKHPGVGHKQAAYQR